VDSPAVTTPVVHQEAHPFSFSSLRLLTGQTRGIALLFSCRSATLLQRSFI
jgi:hypothetical protein